MCYQYVLCKGCYQKKISFIMGFLEGRVGVIKIAKINLKLVEGEDLLALRKAEFWGEWTFYEKL